MSNIVAIALLAAAGTTGFSPSMDAEVGALAGAKITKQASHLRFVENRGQWDAEAKFLARTKGLNVWVTSSGLTYDFHRVVPSSPKLLPHEQPSTRLEPSELVGHVVRVSFDGSNASARTLGQGKLPSYSNFIRDGDDESATLVREFESARVEGLYPGVDLVTYRDAATGGPRYDIVLEPNANLSQIRMRYEGAQNLRVMPDGGVAYDTALGTVREKGLAAFEIDASGSRQAVSVRPRISGGALIYEVPNRDPSKTLVIDPLVASTFIGGSTNDEVHRVAIGPGRRPYVTGVTLSADFPTSIGSYRRNAYDYYDAFVTKFRADLANVIWSTYLGGVNYDHGRGIAVDSSEAAIVAGVTSSGDFPVRNAYQGTYGNGQDGFVAKLRPDGAGLVYSTFIGGSSTEEVNDLAIDDKSRPYITGYTYSTNYPTLNAYQATHSGATDIFVTRLTADGKSLSYSTFLGGASYDYGHSVSVDPTYRAAIVGN
ncbi:MAG TPA: SBBP repeat-containing protein, partial [Fimbriimonas sp.]